jgi:hypothetical protein
VREIAALDNPALTRYTKLHAKLTAIQNHTLRSYVVACMGSTVILIIALQVGWFMFTFFGCCCCFCGFGFGICDEEMEAAADFEEGKVVTAQRRSSKQKKECCKKIVTSYLAVTVVMYIVCYCLMVIYDPQANFDLD